MSKQFERWWRKEGSGLVPRCSEDMESHARRVSEIAWDNGEFVAEREARSEIDRLTAHSAQVREEYIAWWKAWLIDHRSTDVAAWLRAYAKAMPDAHPDGASEVQDILREINGIVTASADEIDRLRADLAQRNEERDTAEAERDEARRELCAEHVSPRAEAKRRGWDCYDKKEVQP